MNLRNLSNFSEIPFINKRVLSRIRVRRSAKTASLSLLLSLALASLLFILPAYCLPEGESVSSGTAAFQRPDAHTLNVTTSDKVIIHYSSFDIAPQEATHFHQPSINSVALNRIFDQDPSNILGTLTANGQIFLINPNGIIFGEGARIDVAGLVASSLNISDSDFLAGNYRFQQTAQPAAIINRGSLFAKDGGYIALLGGAVENKGVIEAQLGSIALASGQKATLSFDNQGLISVVIEEPVKEQVLGPNGERIDSAIKNSGKIQANGGKVILTAKALNNVFDYAVNNSGIIEAGSLVEHNGTVELVASGPDNLIVNSGLLDTSGIQEGADGGDIVIKGDYVINSGTLKANAQDNARAGRIEAVAYEKLTLKGTSLIEAKGKDVNSQGGLVYLYSYGETIAEGGQTIDISGGSLSGDGGFGELSAEGTASMGGNIYGDAQPGFRRGRFIIDPTNVNINSNQTVTTDTTWWATKDIKINKNVTVTGNSGASLFFLADHNSDTLQDWDDGDGEIKQKSGGTGSIITNGGGSITFAGEDIELKDDGVTSSGDISFYYNDSDKEIDQSTYVDTIASYSGTLGIFSTGSLTLESDFDNAVLFAGTNGLRLESDSNSGGEANDIVDLNGNSINTHDGDLVINSRGSDDFQVTQLSAGSGDIQITSGGSVTEDGDASADLVAGLLTVTSSTGIDLDTTVSNLDASVTGTGDINIDDTNAITLDDVDTADGSITISAGGNMTVTDVEAGGTSRDITLTTTGTDRDIVLSGNITATSDTVILSASGNITDTTDSATKVSAQTLKITSADNVGSSGDNNELDTAIQYLEATATGNIYIKEENNLGLRDITTTDGLIDIQAAGNITLFATRTITAGGSGDVSLNATNGDLALRGSIDALGDTVTLSSSGDITDTTDGATDISAATLTVSSADSLGGSGADEELDTDVDSITATVTGDTYILEEDAVTLISVTTTDGLIDIEAAGTITASSVSAGGDGRNISLTTTGSDVIVDNVTASGDTVTINSSGSIDEAALEDAAVDITASTIDLDAVSGIGSNRALETQATSISADTTNGSIDINNDSSSDTTASSLTTGTGNIAFGQTGGGKLTITSATTSDGSITLTSANSLEATSVNASGSGQDVSLTSAQGGLILTSVLADDDITATATTGDITMGQVGDAGTDDVTITATAGSINETGTGDASVDITADSLTLTAQDEIGGPGELDIETTIASLDASSTSSGDIVITETDAITLTDVDTNNGSITITAGGAIAATDVASDTGVMGTNDINLTASSGDVTIYTISSDDDVTVEATTGAILDDIVDTTYVSGDWVTLRASGNIGGAGTSEDVDTTADTITAISTGGGDIYLNEKDGATFDTVSTNGSAVLKAGGTTTLGSITVEGDFSFTTSSGDINIQSGTVTSTGAGITLITQAGSILGLGSGTHISSSGSSRLEATAIIGTGTTPIVVDIPTASLYLYTLGRRDNLSANINGAVGTLVFLNTPPGLVLLNNLPRGGAGMRDISDASSPGRGEVFDFPQAPLLRLYQVNAFDAHGPVYFYHPFTQISALEPEGIGIDAYEFFAQEIRLKGHEGLLPYLELESSTSED